MAHLRCVNHVLRSYFNCNISNVHKGLHETHTHSEQLLQPTTEPCE